MVRLLANNKRPDDHLKGYSRDCNIDPTKLLGGRVAHPLRLLQKDGIPELSGPVFF
jgi:hypothetical protein